MCFRRWCNYEITYGYFLPHVIGHVRSLSARNGTFEGQFVHPSSPSVMHCSDSSLSFQYIFLIRPAKTSVALLLLGNEQLLLLPSRREGLGTSHGQRPKTHRSQPVPLALVWGLGHTTQWQNVLWSVGSWHFLARTRTPSWTNNLIRLYRDSPVQLMIVQNHSSPFASCFVKSSCGTLSLGSHGLACHTACLLKAHQETGSILDGCHCVCDNDMWLTLCLWAKRLETSHCF